MPKNIYRNKAGEILPSVTGLCDLLTTRQKQDNLMDWSWKLGRENKPWRGELKSAGDIGTLVHEAVLEYLSTDVVPDFKGNQQVNLCFNKFLAWLNRDAKYYGKPVLETPFVSEKLHFGGQPDIYVLIGNRYRLIDIKTSNGIYESYWYQLAGYDILLRENGYKVDEYQILWLPKDDRFDCPIRTDLRKEKQIFKNLLKIYQLRRANG